MPDLTSHAVRRGPDLPAAPADTVVLDYDARFLRRKVLVTKAGHSLHVDLPETISLGDGDAFETVDGTLVAVVAAPEPLIEIHAGPDDLARLAWHIGNRHTPAQIAPGRILIREDHVMADMLARLGAHTHAVTAPFTPEGGAYGSGRTHGHHHGNDARTDPDAAARGTDQPHGH